LAPEQQAVLTVPAVSTAETIIYRVMTALQGKVQKQARPLLHFVMFAVLANILDLEVQLAAYTAMLESTE